MISSDEFFLQKSYAQHLDSFDYSKKEVIFLNDTQNGVYAGGQQVSFDMASLGVSNKYLNWEEGQLQVPLVMTLHCPSATGNALSSDISNAFACSLKNGTHQLINSIKATIGNVDLINSQLLTNLKIHYDIVSSWSDSDVKTVGSVMNFHGIDNPDSEEYFPAASSNGLGICNNRICPKDTTNNFTPFNGYGASYDEGNLSRRARMNNTSFDIITTNNTLAPFITEANIKATGKNHVVNSNSTASSNLSQQAIVYYIIATIPLSVIHPVFRSIHMTKNMYLKLDFNFNTNYTTLFTFTAASATPTYASYTNSGAALSCPFMVSPLGVSATSTATNVTGLKPSSTQVSFQVQLQLSKATVNGIPYQNPILASCRLYVPQYTLSPQAEEKYLTAVPQKRIVFEDYMYANTNLTNILTGGSHYSSNLFSQKRLRGILLIPQMSAATHFGGSPLLSPFTGNGTCPYGRVTNFNVLINGSPWFPQNINYGWEMYANEILKSKGTIFGNAMTGIKSGLLDENAWQTNNNYVYVDLSRWESLALDNANKSVGLSFTNAAAVSCDYHVFLMYEREITINTSTGQIVLNQ